MPGQRNPLRNEKIFELLGYRPNGDFFSWYRADPYSLLEARGGQRGPTWQARLKARLEATKTPPSHLDMPGLVDHQLDAATLLHYDNGEVVSLFWDGNAVAIASLHRNLDPKDGTRFARLVKERFLTWCQETMTEDLFTSESAAVMFLVQAPGDLAEREWRLVYEGALLMMAVYLISDEEA